MKLVIVIRRDLGMRRGKEIAQGAHAAMGAFNDTMARLGPLAVDYVNPWIEHGRKKVVLKVSSEEALLALAERAEEMNLGHYLVRDAGRTEVEPLTPTALGLGPEYEGRLDKLTGDLELY